MKKVVLVVCLTLAAVLLLLPIYGGKKAQMTLNDFVAYVNKTAPGSAAWLSYEQGWFSSRAVLNFDASAYLGLPASATEQALIIPLQLDLKHGPIIVDGGFTLGWFAGRWYLDSAHEAWTVDNDIHVEGSGPFFTSRFHMALTGVVSFYEQTLPFALSVHDKLFSVAGYEGEGTYRPYGALDYRGGFASASLNADGGGFFLEGMEVTFTSNLNRRVGAFAVPGELKFSLQKAAVVSDDDSLSELDDIELATSFSINQDAPELGDITLAAALGRAEIMGDSISSVAVEVALRRMSLAFYNQYMQQVQRGHKDNKQSALQGMQMLSLMNNELLPRGPELHVSQLSFSAPEGEFTATGHLRVPEGAVKGQLDPFAMIGHIDAQLELEVDKPLAYKLAHYSAANHVDEQAFASGEILSQRERQKAIEERSAMQIQTLLQQGFIREEGERLFVKLSLLGGTATINEQTIPLPF